MNIRPVSLNDSPAIAKIQVESYQHTYADIFPPAYLAHFTLEEQEFDWRGLLSTEMKDILLVAEDSSGQLAGYALACISTDTAVPYDGELVALHVSKSFQRQQVGTRLFSAACAGLQQQGCDSLFLWVLEANPARSFYEKLGGQRFCRKPWANNTYFETEIYEIAYGWKSMQSLLDLFEKSGE